MNHKDRPGMEWVVQIRRPVFKQLNPRRVLISCLTAFTCDDFLNCLTWLNQTVLRMNGPLHPLN